MHWRNARLRARLASASAIAMLAMSLPGAAGPGSEPSFNLYGTTGLIDTPTAEQARDGLLTATISDFGATRRTTLSFQITPRLQGSFRYARIDGLVVPNFDGEVYFDRSFDLRYQLVEETDHLPGIAVGLQDFIGTGLYESEYIVATKSVTPQLSFSGGIGWGRLGSDSPLGSTGTRPSDLLGRGGIPNYDRWFRGDYAAFGGLRWSSKDNRWSVKAEYSSDLYLEEVSDGVIDRASPWNFGVDYRFTGGGQVSAYSLYGTEVGLQFTLALDPKTPAAASGTEPAPLPVAPRAPGAARDLGWQTDGTTARNSRAQLIGLLETERLGFEGLRIDGRSATLRINNPTYNAMPQAVGRAARAMTRVLPASVETFVIVLTTNGMEASAVTLRRSDLERLENAPASAMLAQAQIGEGRGVGPALDTHAYPRFRWSLAPYLAVSVFDPENPVRADAGLRLNLDYSIRPNLVFSSSITGKLGGNIDEIDRDDKTGLARVRTDAAEYSRQGNPAITHLTFTGYGRPGPDLYSRVTAGYLETMFAGVSGEVLWKPVNSPLALGLELNYVQQREFDQLFGLRDYDVFMGHASAYYDFGNGFHGQLDVGKYLAGDLGATVSLDREFDNGWRVGAYATFTDADVDDFGEGSFDKGIRITIPTSYSAGNASRKANNIGIQSLTRDGGARLSVRDRLYEKVRDAHRPEMEDTWGRFWR